MQLQTFQMIHTCDERSSSCGCMNIILSWLEPKWNRAWNEKTTQGYAHKLAEALGLFGVLVTYRMGHKDFLRLLKKSTTAGNAQWPAWLLPPKGLEIRWATATLRPNDNIYLAREIQMGNKDVSILVNQGRNNRLHVTRPKQYKCSKLKHYLWGKAFGWRTNG